MNLTWDLRLGDVRERLRELPTGSVQTCVTSPPYWGLRDYGHADQIGLEGTPDAYVSILVAVFAEVRRVLADDGTLWVNLGDSYAGGKTGRADGDTLPRPKGGSYVVGYGYQRDVPYGFKPKDLVGIPWRVAFALQADGWYLRSDVIWHKPNPMPESVTDRPTKAHEYLFLLSKSARYYYDADAIAEAAADLSRVGQDVGRWGNATKPSRASAMGRNESGNEAKAAHWVMGETRNKRSVWTVPTAPYPDAHFATYPPALIEPCILAGSAKGDTVLDPFTGSGTTGEVALRLGRHFVGCELNPAYLQLARKRLGAVAPLFATEVSA